MESICQQVPQQVPMKNYDRINALPPDGIERKRAHIIGGGIAGFATAAFLIDDAHMPGENITIYEVAELPGVCLDCYPRGKRRDTGIAIAHVGPYTTPFRRR